MPHYIGDPKLFRWPSDLEPREDTYSRCYRGGHPKLLREEMPDSDVDILLEFSLPVGLFKLVRTQRYLERLFGRAMGAGAIPLNRLHREIES